MGGSEFDVSCMEYPSCLSSVLPFYNLNNDEFIDTLLLSDAIKKKMLMN